MLELVFLQVGGGSIATIEQTALSVIEIPGLAVRGQSLTRQGVAVVLENPQAS
jgi:hypothetical protein